MRAPRRRRQSGGGRCRAFRAAIDEAHAILPRSSSARSATADRAHSPTASSGCWRSRWRWRRGRRCCCSTSRRRACRARKAGALFAAIDGAVAGHRRAVHRARHGLGVPLRQPRHRDGGRAHPGARARPHEIAADPRVREVYLGGAGQRAARTASWLSRCSRSTTCAPAMAPPSCSTASRFDLAGARQPRGARPQRRRQDDAAAHHHGLHPGAAAATSAGAGEDITRLAPHRRARPASAGWRRSARFSRRSRSRRT